MKPCIKNLKKRFERHPRLRQWAWFFALWSGGLMVVTIMAGILKIIIRSI